MVRVIFYKARYGNFADKAIAWWTSPIKDKLNGRWLDSYSHCEVLFTSGLMFSASQWDNAVRFKQHKYNETLWTYVPVSWDEDTVKAKAQSLDAKGYDYMGVLGFIFDSFEHDKDKWFCSEIVDELGVIAGDSRLDKNSYKVSPNELYKRLTYE